MFSRTGPKFLAIVFLLCLTACWRDIPTVVNIRVVGPNGQEVSGVSVRLYSPVDSTAVSQGIIDYSENTGADGVAEFDLSEDYKDGQNGQYLLDVEATSGSLSGTTSVKVEPRATTERTLILN